MVRSMKHLSWIWKVWNNGVAYVMPQRRANMFVVFGIRCVACIPHSNLLADVGVFRGVMYVVMLGHLPMLALLRVFYWGICLGFTISCDVFQWRLYLRTVVHVSYGGFCQGLSYSASKMHRHLALPFYVRPLRYDARLMLGPANVHLYSNPNRVV